MSDLIYISIKDALLIFQKNKKRAFRFAVSIAVITFFLILFCHEPKFRAEASFKHAMAKREEIASLRGLLKNFQTGSDGSDAIPIMFSRTLLEETIASTGLQIAVARNKLIDFFYRAKNNLFREFGKIDLTFSDFEFKEVDYMEEFEDKVFLVFSDAFHFDVLDKAGKKIGSSQLGNRFQSSKLSFILNRAPESLQKQRKYSFKVFPKYQVLKSVLSSLEIRPSKISSNLLNLIFEHPVRKTAVFFLNSLMTGYQTYLHLENETTANHQLAFLEKRKEHLCLELKNNLKKYAQYLKNNLKENGVMGLSEQIELVAVPLENEYLEKLSLLALEKKQYEKKVEVPHLVQKTAQPKNSAKEFLGLNKEMARELHINYTGELDNLQVRLKQLSNLLTQIGDPLFELSSLSSVLNDPVSQKIINQASELGLFLRDEMNRSHKEHERIKNDLRVQKEFLQQHVHEIINIENIRVRVLEEKIFSLKNIALNLIETEEKQLQEQLQIFREQVSSFPDKWLHEGELAFKKKMNMKVIETMTQLTESKVLQQLLFQVESKPLDKAYAPIQSNRPYLFLFSLISAILAFGTIVIWDLLKPHIVLF